MAKKKITEPAASRAQAGDTQAAAALAVGVSRRTWQDWELGVNTMHPGLLRLYRHLAGLERIPFRGVDYPRPEES